MPLCPPHQARFTAFPLRPKYLVLFAPVTHCAATIYYAERFLVIQCTFDVCTRRSIAVESVFRVDTIPVCNCIAVSVVQFRAVFWIFSRLIRRRSLLLTVPFTKSFEKTEHEFCRIIFELLCFSPHKWYLRPISTTI